MVNPKQYSPATGFLINSVGSGLWNGAVSSSISFSTRALRCGGTIRENIANLHLAAKYVYSNLAKLIPFNTRRESLFTNASFTCR